LVPSFCIFAVAVTVIIQTAGGINANAFLFPSLNAHPHPPSVPRQPHGQTVFFLGYHQFAERLSLLLVDATIPPGCLVTILLLLSHAAAQQKLLAMLLPRLCDATHALLFPPACCCRCYLFPG